MNLSDRAKELLRELVSIESVSGNEYRIQKFIEDFLGRLDLEVVRQEVAEGRFNLIHENGSEHLISCHVDTVPPLGMSEPFKATELSGRIYGRGTSDVKGALASLLTAVEVFSRERKRLPVSLAFVVDEETNSALGSEKAVELLGKGRKCLVLEPTYGKLCTSQFGSLEFRVHVRGESVHGAEFERVENPVKVCMELVSSLERKLNRGVNILQIEAGSGFYLVPEECTALLEVKVHRGEPCQELETVLNEVIKGIGTGCSIELGVEDAEEFIDFRSDGFVNLLEKVFMEATGRKPERGIMPSWTDASNYHRAGYECVVFGFGSLAVSHTSRESISVRELEDMTSFFIKLFEELS